MHIQDGAPSIPIPAVSQVAGIGGGWAAAGPASVAHLGALHAPERLLRHLALTRWAKRGLGGAGGWPNLGGSVNTAPKKVVMTWGWLGDGLLWGLHIHYVLVL